MTRAQISRRKRRPVAHADACPRRPILVRTAREEHLLPTTTAPTTVPSDAPSRIDEQPLAQRLRRPPTPGDLAADLGVPEPDVLDALRARGAYRSLSLQAGAEYAAALGERIGAVDPGFDAVENGMVLRAALPQLPDR